MSLEREMKFGSFLAGYGGLKETRGNVENIDYRRISIDSRTIAPGELFVAIKGEVHDGHRFVEKALGKKAGAVVVDAEWFGKSQQLPGNENIVVVADTLDFLQQLGAYHRRQLDVTVVGITGSNGKTTTREMIAAVLRKKYRVFQSEGNKNNHIGLPLMLLKLQESHEIAVIEMGTNHPGEIGLLASLSAPDVAVITNIGKGHIGFFGTLAAVYEEKTALFRETKPGGTIVLNTDDPLLKDYPCGEMKCVTVGFQGMANVAGEILGADRLGRYELRAGADLRARLGVPGKHNTINALLAVAVGEQFAVGHTEISRALTEFSPADQRMEVFEKGETVFVNDAYNANPNSMHAAVDYVAELDVKKGKRILALGDMLELGDLAESEHYALGEYIAGKKIDVVFLYGPESRHTGEGIAAGNKQIDVRWRETHEAIAEELAALLQDDNVVLLKGSRGMKMERVLALLPNLQES